MSKGKADANLVNELHARLYDARDNRITHPYISWMALYQAGNVFYTLTVRRELARPLRRLGTLSAHLVMAHGRLTELLLDDAGTAQMDTYAVSLVGSRVVSLTVSRAVTELSEPAGAQRLPRQAQWHIVEAEPLTQQATIEHIFGTISKFVEDPEQASSDAEQTSAA